jgi:hypothetical protein
VAIKSSFIDPEIIDASSLRAKSPHQVITTPITKFNILVVAVTVCRLRAAWARGHSERDQILPSNVAKPITISSTVVGDGGVWRCLRVAHSFLMRALE